MILVDSPSYWSSAHDPAGMWYEFEFEQVPLSSVTDSSGYAQFDIATPYAFTPIVGGQLYVPGGIYEGLHTITSVVSPTQFVTSTAYTANSSGGIQYVRTPQIEVWVGYDVGENYDIQKPMTKVGVFTPEVWPDRKIRFNVAGYVAPSFGEVSVPTSTIDFALFNRFRIFFDGVFDRPYQVLNSAITHAELAAFVGNVSYLNTEAPPVSWACGYTTLTHIQNDLVITHYRLDGVALPIAAPGVSLPPVTPYPNCCDNQCNIVWLNRQGGWQNYIFTGVKTFDVETGEAKEFITSELIKKTLEIRGSYDGRICTTGSIPKNHVDIIMGSLKRSIQAYLLIGDPADPNNFKEIILDRGKFTKYRSDDKLFDVAIQFYLAKEITIQTQ